MTSWTSCRSGRTPVAEPEIDPVEFANSLVFDAPGTPLDMPVPPLLGDDEQILVHRSVELNLLPDADARLRAKAARNSMTLEEYVVYAAEHAA
jgi:hypothetical protein